MRKGSIALSSPRDLAALQDEFLLRFSRLPVAALMRVRGDFALQRFFLGQRYVSPIELEAPRIVAKTFLRTARKAGMNLASTRDETRVMYSGAAETCVDYATAVVIAVDSDGKIPPVEVKASTAEGREVRVMSAPLPLLTARKIAALPNAHAPEDMLDIWLCLNARRGAINAVSDILNDEAWSVKNFSLDRRRQLVVQLPALFPTRAEWRSITDKPPRPQPEYKQATADLNWWLQSLLLLPL